MDRVHHPTTLATPPAVDAHGTPGYPTEGNPGSGVQATVLTAWVVHSLIEEIRAVIVAGGLTPAKGDLTQLRTALAALYGGGGTLGANGWQRLPGGLIVQWGAVARASRTLSTNTVVTFPLAFPNACYVVIPTIDFDNPGLLDMSAGADTPTLTQVTLLAGITMTESTETRTFGWRWLALGR